MIEEGIIKRWTVVGVDFALPEKFMVIYKGDSYEDALQALTVATYEYSYVRLEFHG